MLKIVILRIILILLLSFAPIKAFSYELITGIGYGQSNYKGTKTGTVIASLDAYVPLWFDGFNVGIGTSYLGADLGSSLDLARNFPVYSVVEEKNVTMALIPVYIGAKYEYFFNKDFSIFTSGRYGISLGNKKYYTGKDYFEDEEGKQRTSIDSLEMWGNMMYGVSIGVSFFNNYMISLNYDIMAMKNIYHITKLSIGDRSEITQAESVSIKLAYAFRK